MGSRASKNARGLREIQRLTPEEFYDIWLFTTSQFGTKPFLTKYQLILLCFGFVRSSYNNKYNPNNIGIIIYNFIGMEYDQWWFKFRSSNILKYNYINIKLKELTYPIKSKLNDHCYIRNEWHVTYGTIVINPRKIKKFYWIFKILYGYIDSIIGIMKISGHDKYGVNNHYYLDGSTHLFDHSGTSSTHTTGYALYSRKGKTLTQPPQRTRDSTTKFWGKNRFWKPNSTLIMLLDYKRKELSFNINNTGYNLVIDIDKCKYKLLVELTQSRYATVNGTLRLVECGIT